MAARTARSVVVAGGGLAAYHFGYALRRLGFDGSIDVLGAEPHLPYDRPPLSKAFLAGDVDRGALALDDPTAPLDVRWHLGAPAERLLAGPGERPGVLTARGEFRADAVVLATGADPVRLGAGVPGVHVLRSLDDAEALRADGVAGRRVVVVGAGFIGLETAATAVKLGAGSVTVVSPEAVPLAERFGADVGAAVAGLHRAAGVELLGGLAVRGLTTDATGRVAGVIVDGSVDSSVDGGFIVAADLVILGLGVRPATGWLAGALQLAGNGAVVCDATGATGLDSVWAVGDCAVWAHADGSGLRRAGHWQDALDHAAVVAAALTGNPAPELPEPYCWSDQFGVTLQTAGHLHGDEEAVVLAGTVAGGDLLVGYHRHGEQTAILGMNRPREVTRWRRTRRARTPLVAA